MELHFQWKAKTGQYQSGETLYLNRIRIGGYEWNSTRGKGDTESGDYSGALYLPSLKNAGVTGSLEDIKPKLERIACGWFREALK